MHVKTVGLVFGKLHCYARKQCSLQTRACNAGTFSGKQVVFLENLQEANIEVHQLLLFLRNMEAPFDTSEGDAATRIMQMELQLVQTQTRILQAYVGYFGQAAYAIKGIVRIAAGPRSSTSG